MEKILKLKSFLMAIMVIASAISFASCDTGGEEYDYPVDDPVSTGLCGTKWVFGGATGSSETYYTSYTFNVDGRGIHEFTEENGERGTSPFTWTSYNIGSSSMHMLIIVIDKTEMMTYYNVTGNTLRLNDGSGNVYTYYPEEEINKE